MNDKALTGAVVDLTFDDGSVYRMSSLSDRDVVEVDLWLQKRIVDLARESARDEEDEKVREETVSVALRVAMTVTWMTPVGAKILSTPFGLARLLYQSCKKNHPPGALSESKMREQLVRSAHNVTEVNQAFVQLNMSVEAEKPKPEKPGGKRKRPTTASKRPVA